MNFWFQTKKKRLTKYTGVSLTLRCSLEWPHDLAMLSQNEKLNWVNTRIGQDRKNNIKKKSNFCCFESKSGYIGTLRRHNIHGAYHDDVGSINMFDVVMLLDDSGIVFFFQRKDCLI
jgi:hypothetical protein